MSIARSVSPFSDYDAGDVHWVQPKLVGEVAHQAAAPAFLEGAHRRESEADRASPGHAGRHPTRRGRAAFQQILAAYTLSTPDDGVLYNALYNAVVQRASTLKIGLERFDRV